MPIKQTGAITDLNEWFNWNGLTLSTSKTTIIKYIYKNENLKVSDDACELISTVVTCFVVL